MEFVIGNTWYGAFAVLADGHHEASALCLKHIWQVCVDKLKDDLIIIAPAKDTVLFAPAGQPEVVKKMEDHAKMAYDRVKTRSAWRSFVFWQTEGTGDL